MVSAFSGSYLTANAAVLLGGIIADGGQTVIPVAVSPTAHEHRKGALVLLNAVRG